MYTASSVSVLTRYTFSVHPLRVSALPTLLTFQLTLTLSPGVSVVCLMATSLTSRSGLGARWMV